MAEEDLWGLLHPELFGLLAQGWQYWAIIIPKLQLLQNENIAL